MKPKVTFNEEQARVVAQLIDKAIKKGKEEGAKAKAKETFDEFKNIWSLNVVNREDFTNEQINALNKVSIRMFEILDEGVDL